MAQILEQKTQGDASGNVVTFQKVIAEIEIFNSSNQTGIFTVNGFAITVPAGAGYRSRLRGDMQPTVTISGATSYEIRRLG
jgi:hypothetical protein